MEPKKIDHSLRYRAKRTAKQCIMRNLLPVMAAVLICVLPFVLVAGPMQTYILATGSMVLPLALCAAVVIFIILPLVYGLMGFLMRLLSGEKPHILSVFDGLTSLEHYGRSFRLGLCIFVRTVLWMSIPVLATAAYCAVRLERMPEILESAELLLQLIWEMSGLYFVISLPFMARVLRYFIAYPLAMRDPALGAWQATRQAARLFRGHNVQLLVLMVSFLGWQLLGTWTMGIGTLFYWGYLLCTILMYFWYLEHPDGMPSGTGQPQ